jgi:hypothetical protein
MRSCLSRHNDTVTDQVTRHLIVFGHKPNLHDTLYSDARALGALSLGESCVAHTSHGREAAEWRPSVSHLPVKAYHDIPAVAA